jgi:hypothetical protein
MLKEAIIANEGTSVSVSDQVDIIEDYYETPGQSMHFWMACLCVGREIWYRYQLMAACTLVPQVPVL